MGMAFSCVWSCNEWGQLATTDPAESPVVVWRESIYLTQRAHLRIRAGLLHHLAYVFSALFLFLLIMPCLVFFRCGFQFSSEVAWRARSVSMAACTVLTSWTWYLTKRAELGFTIEPAIMYDWWLYQLLARGACESCWASQFLWIHTHTFWMLTKCHTAVLPGFGGEALSYLFSSHKEQSFLKGFSWKPSMKLCVKMKKVYSNFRQRFLCVQHIAPKNLLMWLTHSITDASCMVNLDQLEECVFVQAENILWTPYYYLSRLSVSELALAHAGLSHIEFKIEPFSFFVILCLCCN